MFISLSWFLSLSFSLFLNSFWVPHSRKEQKTLRLLGFGAFGLSFPSENVFYAFWRL